MSLPFAVSGGKPRDAHAVAGCWLMNKRMCEGSALRPAPGMDLMATLPAGAEETRFQAAAALLSRDYRASGGGLPQAVEYVRANACVRFRCRLQDGYGGDGILLEKSQAGNNQSPHYQTDADRKNHATRRSKAFFGGGGYVGRFRHRAARLRLSH